MSEHLGQRGYHVYSYDWPTGPNPGDGFGSSGPQQSTEEHTTAISYFLADIDPDTGYLSEPITRLPNQTSRTSRNRKRPGSKMPPHAANQPQSPVPASAVRAMFSPVDMSPWRASVSAPRE